MEKSISFIVEVFLKYVFIREKYASICIECIECNFDPQNAFKFFPCRDVNEKYTEKNKKTRKLCFCR